MTSTASATAVPRELVLARAAAKAPHVPSEWRMSEAMRAPVFLDRGNVLRIRDGRGMRLTSASGVLWITEEGGVDDTVLVPGDTYQIGSAGTTLALAHRAGRVVLEVPAGASPPRHVELALAEGKPGRRIWFNGRRSLSRAAWAAIGAAIRKAVAFGRGLWARGEPRVPTGGWFEHDSAYSSRRVRHSRRGPGTPPWVDSLGSARDLLPREYPFPHH